MDYRRAHNFHEKKRDRLHLACRNQPFNTNLQEHYNRYRNKLNGLIQKVKSQYYRKQIDEIKGDRKFFWGIINEVTQYKRRKINDIKEIEVEGELISVQKDAKRVANSFNRYFSEVGTNLNQTPIYYLPPTKRTLIL